MAKKTYRFNFTLKSLFFWGIGFLILIIWMFVLGILVGRGDLSFVQVKDKLAGVAEIGPEKKDPSALGKMDDDLKLEFYEELCAKKETATRNSRKNRPGTRESAPEKDPVAVTDKKTVRHKTLGKCDRGYLLQIGSFQDKNRARDLTRKLAEKDYHAFFSKADVDGKTFYRVKCGPFNTVAKADELKRVLAAREKIKGFVTRID